jgi:GNAT superfamily N-acetyltransferase
VNNNRVPEVSLARTINGYLRELAATSRESAAVGPFLGAIDPASDNLYRNYAIPFDAATPTGADIVDLIAWFSKRSRTPRFEYVAEAAPEVESTLLRHGFRVEGRLPLMTCGREELRPCPCPEGIEFVIAGSRALLGQAAAVQNEAYGGGGISEADVDRLAKTVGSGGRVVLAVDRDSGEPAGAGLFGPPLNGVTEIAAIGVAERVRRRGIGAQLTVTLARQAFTDGIATPFLMAAHPAEERIYARVGFVTRCEILHISTSA